MAGVLYYASNRVSVDCEDLAALGLTYAFENNPDCRQCQCGPDDGRGVVFADPGSVGLSELGYHKPRQRWARATAGDFWIGVYDEAPPTPSQLARAVQVAGHYVTLADGNSYLCPVARAFEMNGDSPSAYVALPRTVVADEHGNWNTGGVVPKFRRLWETASRWFDAMRDAGVDDSVARFDFSDIADAALLAIQTNYRVGKDEVSLLGLFDDRCMANVLQALVDWPTLEGWLKKKAVSAAAVG